MAANRFGPVPNMAPVGTPQAKPSGCMIAGIGCAALVPVVAILATVAAIAIPNFVRYRAESRKAVCISNLKQIEMVVEEAKLRDAALPGIGDIRQPAGEPLACPAGGVYSLDADGRPCCSLGAEKGHVLPPEPADDDDVPGDADDEEDRSGE